MHATRLQHHRKQKVVASATILSLAALFAGCQSGLPVDIPVLSGPRISDEEQIVRVLDDVAKAMQSRKIYRVLANVSQNYQDAEGRDYDEVQDYLKTIFRQYRFIEFTRARPRIAVQGDRARAMETFGTRATPFDDTEHRPIDFNGQVIVNLVKQGNRWKITEWSAAG